ncbi:MAG TPA: PTS glucose transporter subunit IIA [Anaerolineaceae bacterium]|nr:PTS glucose transporter subunit IIA [Anaerolineaceae bacterium]
MMEHKIDVYAPASGRVFPLKDVGDEVFSGGLMGVGVAIEMDGSDWTIYAPVDAECSAIFPTGHAVALKHENGLELLIHIGIETFREQGAFEKKVVEKQKVIKGQPLICIAKSFFEKESPLVILTLLNGKNFTLTTNHKEKVIANETILFTILKEN